MPVRSRQSVVTFASKLCDVIPEVMVAMGYERNSCILSTRVGVEAARRHGFHARALSTRLLAANKAVYDLAQKLDRWPEHGEYPEGGWALGIGPDDDRMFAAEDRRGKGYNGHLIIVLHSCIAVDLTLDQASRPQYDMNFRPGYFLVGHDFLRGEKPASLILNDAFVQYEALPNDRGFLHTPDWRMPPHAKAVNPIPRVMRVLTA